MGNPFDKELQRQFLLEGLKYLKAIKEAGTIVDLTMKYRIKGGQCTLCEVEAGRW